MGNQPLEPRLDGDVKVFELTIDEIEHVFRTETGRAIATIARPVIWFLGVSTDVAVRIFGGDPRASREEVSDEELRAMVTSSVTLGDEVMMGTHSAILQGLTMGSRSVAGASACVVKDVPPDTVVKGVPAR